MGSWCRGMPFVSALCVCVCSFVKQETLPTLPHTFNLQLAGDGCGQLVPGKGVPLGAVLHTPEPVRCTIFEDGLQVRVLLQQRV